MSWIDDEYKRKLAWCYPGARIVGASGTVYEVVEEDGSGFWLRNTWTNESDLWKRSSILLNFKPEEHPTRFERVRRQ